MAKSGLYPYFWPTKPFALFAVFWPERTSFNNFQWSLKISAQSMNYSRNDLWITLKWVRIPLKPSSSDLYFVIPSGCSINIDYILIHFLKTLDNACESVSGHLLFFFYRRCFASQYSNVPPIRYLINTTEISLMRTEEGKKMKKICTHTTCGSDLCCDG